MTAKRTELAPIVVERVARRVSDENRRVANRLRSWSILFLAVLLPISMLAGQLEPVLVPIGMFFVARVGARWRDARAELADRVAEVAGRPDLRWSQIQNVIEGHTPGQARPACMLVATPRRGEMLALPAARVVKRDD